ncbi:MAG: hypothetical protein COA69_02060 [Robiginitomaculum sp.]|nr:MAG: hypothetical protein COA69_02060 [Robiginitomaculum sp.]
MSFEQPIFVLLHLAGFAFAMSLAVSGFMIAAGVLDAPVSRSSHTSPVPTGAGLGLVAGLGAGLLGLSMFYPHLGDQAIMGQMAALALGVSLLGLVDDVHEVPPKIKFLFMLILSCACVSVSGPPPTLPLAVMEVDLPVWIGALGAVLWIFVVMNTVNFMDGANGLMGMVMCIAFITLAVISIGAQAVTPAVLSLVMAASLMGFLPYNARKKALIFSGDVGALLCGFMFAACTLLLVTQKPKFGLLYVGPLLILPFLTDVLLTLLIRAYRKESLFVAHNRHMYQRLMKAGHSHVSVTALYAVAGMLMSMLTLASVWFGAVRSIFFFAIWVSILSIIYLTLHKNLGHKNPGHKNLGTSEPDQPHIKPDP